MRTEFPLLQVEGKQTRRAEFNRSGDMKQVWGTHSQLCCGLKRKFTSPRTRRFRKCTAQKTSAPKVFIESAKRLSRLKFRNLFSEHTQTHRVDSFKLCQRRHQ